jgi:hypothetical protein
MLQLLYPLGKRPSTHCTGGWLSLGTENLGPTCGSYTRLSSPYIWTACSVTKHVTQVSINRAQFCWTVMFGWEMVLSVWHGCWLPWRWLVYVLWDNIAGACCIKQRIKASAHRTRPTAAACGQKSVFLYIASSAANRKRLDAAASGRPLVSLQFCIWRQFVDAACWRWTQKNLLA